MIYTNTDWDGTSGQFKTNTVLQYDEEYNKVEKWGRPAFARISTSNTENNEEPKSVRLFKLHLGKLRENLKNKYKLPVEYEKAITDYLREMGKVKRIFIFNVMYCTKSFIYSLLIYYLLYVYLYVNIF